MVCREAVSVKITVKTRQFFELKLGLTFTWCDLFISIDKALRSGCPTNWTRGGVLLQQDPVMFLIPSPSRVG